MVLTDFGLSKEMQPEEVCLHVYIQNGRARLVGSVFFVRVTPDLSA